MRVIPRSLTPAVLLLSIALAAPASAQSASPAAAIDAMMQQSAVDWNRGDLDAFAACYKNSPDIEFIGPVISHGYAGMLSTYRQHYPTRDAMGLLTFSQLNVKPLDDRFATVTGWFHLERKPAGGGNADGYFLLVVENTSAGWKIIRDDTTAHTPIAM